MEFTFYNKDTGEQLPPLEDRDYIVLGDDLYECEFGCMSTDGNHIYEGEAWKVKVPWFVMVKE